MKPYPLFVSLNGSHCLIIGHRPRLLGQAQRLLDAGAKVTLMADQQPPPSMPEGCRFEPLDFSVQAISALEFSGYRLVLADTGDTLVDQHIASRCDVSDVLCNTPSAQESCSFLTPAIVDRAPLQIAVATAGVAPALSRHIKSQLEAALPTEYGQLAELLGHYHDRIQQRIPDASQRSAFWQDLIENKFSSLAYKTGLRDIESALEQIASDPATESTSSTPATAAATAAATTLSSANKSSGSVALIGAGPGAPDLLTFRALRLLQRADVIVYDRLVADEILSLRRPDAELIYAGKAKANHTLPQADINQLLVDLALQGKTVVRLKGGDPFIFGRGGEEIETLAAHNINFQVVPGITAASGCAAFSGIPLTHRDHAQSCVFVTGHLRNGDINLNWQELKDPTQTIVVYMGLTGLELICQKLIAVGRDTDTPAALIERGTTPHHRVHDGTLTTLPRIIASHEVVAPTLLIIGSVVSLRQKLKWFD